MNPHPPTKKPENDLTLKLDHATPPSRPAGIDGVELIYAERVRQITVKRRLPEDDVARNTNGQLAMAGACYALLAGGQSRTERMPGGTPDVNNMAPLRQWPFSGAAWRPSNSALKNLVRAGALIAAEIDRRLALGETIPDDTVPAPIASPTATAPAPTEESAE